MTRDAIARARSELGFELPVDLFALRLAESVECALGRAAPTDRRIPDLLRRLAVVDLYLATGAAAGLPAARELAQRWYGPYIETLASAPGRSALLAEDGPGASLHGYHGLGSLKRWLAAHE